MTGRGIDQILLHPCDPVLYEGHMKSALGYVALAESAHGAIERPVDFHYIWGAAIEELSRRAPDAIIVNLETAITGDGTPEPKGINYRMNPANVPVLAAAGIDCCSLANNHVKDWGEAGLNETLASLKGAGILTAGAGRTLSEAAEPAILTLNPGSRVLVFAAGLESSGIPPDWAAAPDRAGIKLLPDLSKETAELLAAEMLSQKRLGDIAVLSVHWGSNWGYDVPEAQQAFAHTLIDLGGCDILHGHSSHHSRPIEVYKAKLILYGCGDLINDYEGIKGYEEFRDDLCALYFADVNEVDGVLASLTIVPFRIHRFRLQRARLNDARWLQSTLNSVSTGFKTPLSLNPDGTLGLGLGRSL